MYLSGGLYYLFMSKTGVDQPEVPVETATVPGDWSAATDALPEMPSWATPGWAWAPDVHQFGSHFVLYFTSLVRGTATMCIGAAVSSEIAGPYKAISTPFICQPQLGGSIDPRTFVDANGKLYMVWKSDQDAVSHDTDTLVFSEPLSSDGLHLLGQPTVIFEPDLSWQGYIVEAPQLVDVQGAYYLFYSANWFNNPSYAIGAARCDGPLGPCADTSPEPLLQSNSQGAGPGEQSVFSDPSGIWMLYSPTYSTEPFSDRPRPTDITRLGFGPSGPYLAITPANPADT
jgi:beta-xylosidase